MANFKEGDRVQIIARAQTNDDIKERTYYPYMGGLRGIIYRLYNDGRAAVQVDLDSLPEAVQSRHTEAQERMKNRWIESLSEEARARLTPEEREFHLNYVLLVRVEDLQPVTKRTRTTTAKLAAQASVTEPAPTPHPAKTSQKRTPPSATAAASDVEAPKRKTLKDFEKAEEEFLKSRHRTAR